MVGTITFAVTVVAAIAAWSTGETYHLDLNQIAEPNTVPLEI
jgi:hypothetical protein